MTFPATPEFLTPSLLDRLTDPTSGGVLQRKGYSIEQMVEAVRRDLEDLLNTRRTNPNIPATYEETLHSIEAFGIPDLTSLKAFTPQQRQGIARLLEQIIVQFEPRLKDVQVRQVESKDLSRRSIRFHIFARLLVEPAPEVAFETIMELTTGQANIEACMP